VVRLELASLLFPTPWHVVEMAGCFIVQDATGQNVAWFEVGCCAS
jgi:hypothetical protein